MIERPLRIMITNHRLEGRAGTQSAVRDLTRGLQRLGHYVMAYSSDLSQVERVLENDFIPVATDPADLQERPDIIHGNHHLDVMTALAALPDVPAIYHCHGAAWRDFIPRHPRIYRYFAVAHTARERIIAESNLAASDIEVFNNYLDPERFRVVRQPPARLERALFYNSRHQADSPTLRAIQEATQQCGIELECAGYHFNRPVEHPENELPQYDVVFASGISAIEAIASGCATIVLGRDTSGELVTPDNFEQTLAVNFSASANLPPPSVEAVVAQLLRYSAQEVSDVTQQLRTRCDVRLAAERIEGIYREVIERHGQTKPDAAAEIAAFGHYLRRLSPLVKLTDVTLERHWASSTRSESLYALRAETVLLRMRIEAAEHKSEAPEK